MMPYAFNEIDLLTNDLKYNFYVWKRLKQISKEHISLSKEMKNVEKTLKNTLAYFDKPEKKEDKTKH